MQLLFYRAAIIVVENEIKRIPSILKEVPKSQIADMRRQVLQKILSENVFEWTERGKIKEL